MKRAISAAAAIVALALAQPANALAIAEGSFGFVPLGAVVLDTGDITAATAGAAYGAAFVNVAGSGNLPIALFDAVAAGPFTFPAGLGDGPVPAFDVIVAGLTFTFGFGDTVARVATTDALGGGIAAAYIGIISNGGGIFEAGTQALLSMSCDQTKISGPVNCSNTTIAVGRVPEPASLALMAGGLVWLGLLLFGRRDPASA